MKTKINQIEAFKAIENVYKEYSNVLKISSVSLTFSKEANNDTSLSLLLEIEVDGKSDFLHANLYKDEHLRYENLMHELKYRIEKRILSGKTKISME